MQLFCNIFISVKIHWFCEREKCQRVIERVPPITYHWTVPLILYHSYLVGKLTSLKTADT